ERCAASRFLVASPLVPDLLLCAKHLFVAAMGTSGGHKTMAGSGRYHCTIQLCRTAAREEGVCHRCLTLASLHLMKSLAVGRAVAHMNPPAAVPQIRERIAFEAETEIWFPRRQKTVSIVFLVELCAGTRQAACPFARFTNRWPRSRVARPGPLQVLKLSMSI